MKFETFQKIIVSGVSIYVMICVAPLWAFKLFTLIAIITLGVWVSSVHEMAAALGDLTLDKEKIENEEK